MKNDATDIIKDYSSLSLNELYTESCNIIRDMCDSIHIDNHQGFREKSERFRAIWECISQKKREKGILK